MIQKIHPAVFVAAGFFLILVCQLVQPSFVALLCVGVFLFALLQARVELITVLRRIRFVFLTLVILFAWQTAGDFVLPAIGIFSPTWEGLRLAGEHTMRLLTIATVVALLSHFLAAEDWVNSLLSLSAPTKMLGISPERFAVRLRLVLEYVAARDLDWRHCLDAASDTAQAGEVWPVRHLRFFDYVLLLIFAMAMLGYCIWHG